MRKRILGPSQKEVLNLLNKFGPWRDATYAIPAWIWDTPSRTKLMLDSLVRRGLVKVEKDKDGIQTWSLVESHGNR